MNRKALGVGIATVLAAGVISTSAFAGAVFGTNSQKGSLVIYPRIDIRPGWATYIELTNDSTADQLLKCYYASSDPMTTPFSGNARALKHYVDFTFPITHNQSVIWDAASGYAVYGSGKFQGYVAPPFGVYYDGSTQRFTGELKCWVIDATTGVQKSWNHIFGGASIFQIAGNQGSQYSAWGFQAQYATGSLSATPGLLTLNNVDYDACPNMLLGEFIANDGTATGPQNTVTLASCNEDLRQNFTPTVTKLTWTFWNQDEAQRTSFHTCADSWFEYIFPNNYSWVTGQGGLGTGHGYFRIETTADTSYCAGAVTSAYVGVIHSSFGANYLRGTNLTGRGPATGVIKYDVGPPDSFRPSN